MLTLTLRWASFAIFGGKCQTAYRRGLCWLGSAGVEGSTACDGTGAGRGQISAISRSCSITPVR